MLDIQLNGFLGVGCADQFTLLKRLRTGQEFVADPFQ
jgi:hypothetical protein